MIERIKGSIAGRIHIIAVAASVITVLALIFIVEGHKAPESSTSNTILIEETQKAKETQKPTESDTPEESDTPVSSETPPISQAPSAESAAKRQNPSSESVSAEDIEYSELNGMALDPDTGTDRYNTEPVPEGMPVPEEPQEAVVSDNVYTCILSVSCASILSDITRLDSEKHELVPEDGYIFAPQEVRFNEGESVFDVLQRTMRDTGIHMEFVNTPMYNSAYIEGINNLYEFDCGSGSGWKYRVNGWFPNYGCSRYALHDGDVVEWLYTCDFGRDIE